MEKAKDMISKDERDVASKETVQYEPDPIDVEEEQENEWESRIDRGV